MEMMKKPITIVGCGPGNPDLLTRAAEQAVRQAEVLIGARHLLELFADAGEEIIPVEANIPGILDEMEKRREKRIVVLVSGDTGLYSLANSVTKRFGHKNCCLIPGVSSVQVAFARLGIDWSDARIISAHGRTPQVTEQDLVGWDKIALLAGTREAVYYASDLLRRLESEFTAVTCENLTLSNEQVRIMDAEALRKEPLASRTVILLLRKELLA